MYQVRYQVAQGRHHTSTFRELEQAIAFATAHDRVPVLLGDGKQLVWPYLIIQEVPPQPEPVQEPQLATAAAELPPVLTPAQAAKVLQIGRNQVYELCHQRQIPHVRIGQRIRIPRDALLAWLTKQQTA
jgi:excisionase family DNA binding protein